VFGRRLAAIGDELELDGLSLVERAQPCPFNCGNVDENVLIAAGWVDEPVAFGRVEPFDGALLHRLSPKSVIAAGETRNASLQAALQPGFCEDPKRCVHHAEPPERPKSDCTAIRISKMRLNQGFVAARGTRMTRAQQPPIIFTTVLDHDFRPQRRASSCRLGAGTCLGKPSPALGSLWR